MQGADDDGTTRMILNALRGNRETDSDQARAQSRVDAIVASARAKVAEAEAPKRSVYRSPDQLPLIASTDPTEIRVSEELAHTRRIIEALGDELANDPILLMRYQNALQSVDLMAQTLGHLASVVGSANKQEAIERIGMSSLKARLSRCTVADGAAFHRSETNPFA
jgi:hypothetical protein